MSAQGHAPFPLQQAQHCGEVALGGFCRAHLAVRTANIVKDGLILDSDSLKSPR